MSRTRSDFLEPFYTSDLLKRVCSLGSSWRRRRWPANRYTLSFSPRRIHHASSGLKVKPIKMSFRHHR